MLPQVFQSSAKQLLRSCLSYSQWHWTRTVMTKTLDPFHPEATEAVDVRTSLEFELDHIPGAHNLPVLKSEQRIEVGTIYSRDTFRARKLGASLVSRNIADHIAHYFSSKDSDYCPLVYCWRGGQRSHSLAIVLSQTGFRVLVLEGGYQTYRQAVRQDIEHLPLDLTFRVITGLTGTGKTLLLQTLKKYGGQVLDLEGLARHKGSLLGLWHKETQPSQKLWESQLRHHLASFDVTQPVWVESESRKLGNLTLPPTLFKKMCEADRVEVCLPIQERVQHILKDYPHWMSNIEELKRVLAMLKKVRGQRMLDRWYSLAEQGRWEEFVELLLLEHYDLTYSVSQKKNSHAKEKLTYTLQDLSEQSLANFVKQVQLFG